MGKKTPSPPAAPDPIATANAQAAANKETAIAQSQLNMVDQYTPYGSLVYNQIGNSGPTFDQSAYDQAISAYHDSLNAYNNGGSSSNVSFGNSKAGKAGRGQIALFGGGGSSTPVAPDPNNYYTSTGGVPRYSATQTLSPEQQAILDQTNQASLKYGQTANNQLNQVANTLSTPLDISSLGPVPQADQNAWQNSYDGLIQRNQPQADQQRSALETRLANQGIGYGSDAWKSAMDDFSRSQNDFGLAAQNAATTDMSQRYGLANTAYNQGLNSMITSRSQPLNELAAMMTGSQVQSPTYVNTPQTQVGQTPVADSIYGSYNGQMNAYNSQLQNNAAQTSGLFGLLGAGAGAFGAINPFGWGK